MRGKTLTALIGRKFSHCHALFALISLVFLLFGDTLLNPNQTVLSSSRADIYLHFISWRQFAFHQLSQGIIPLWTPHYLCGTPFLGGFESAVLYPPNLIFLFLPLAAAINWGIIFHFLITGIFSYGWAASQRFHPLAGLLVACITLFNGCIFLHLFAGHLPNVCAMAWIPLIFWTTEELMKQLSLRWCLIGVLAVTMQILAGHPQYVYYTFLLVLLYSLILGFWGPQQKKNWVGMLIVYSGAAGFSAAQLLTGIQAVKECGRINGMDFKTAGVFSFPPENLLTLFMPDFFGPPGDAHYWGRWYLWEVSIFIGLGTVFLVLYSLLKIKSKDISWWMMTLFSFVLSLGEYTPLFHFLYNNLPGYQSFRGSCKYSIFVVLFLSLLAGSGLNEMLKSKTVGGRVKIIPLGLSLLFLILGLAIFYSSQMGLTGIWAHWFSNISWLRKEFTLLDIKTGEDFLKNAGFQSAQSLWSAAFNSCLIGFCCWWAQSSQKGIYALAFLSILELFLFARFHRPTFEMDLANKKYGLVENFYKGHPGDYRVYGTASDSLVEKGFDIWEDEPMVLGRYGGFVAASQGFPEEQLFRVSPVFNHFDPIFGMIRLKYILSSTGNDSLQAIPMRFKTMPRVLICHNYQMIHDPNEGMKTLLSPSFKPSDLILLEQIPEPLPLKSFTQESITYQDISVNRMDIQAKLTKPGILLVTDNYSLGWKAYPDWDSVQKKYVVLPANCFLRAIPLEAGEHRIHLVYEPDAFRVGLWISLVSLTIYIVILSFYLRRNKFFKILKAG